MANCSKERAGRPVTVPSESVADTETALWTYHELVAGETHASEISTSHAEFDAAPLASAIPNLRASIDAIALAAGVPR